MSEPESWEVAREQLRAEYARLVPWQSSTELQDEVVAAYGRLEETYRRVRKGRLMKYKLIVFDLDGTLGDPPDVNRRENKIPKRFRKSPNDWQLFPGRKERLAELQAAGIKTAIATNQGGVAYGWLDRDEMMLWLTNLARELGTEGNQVCFNHPHGTVGQFRKEDYDRKPLPGMLFKAMAYHFALPCQTLFVGDRSDDEQAAKNASCDFTWSHDFFKDG